MQARRLRASKTQTRIQHSRSPFLAERPEKRIGDERKGRLGRDTNAPE